MKTPQSTLKEASRIGEYFRGLPYEKFELTLFDTDFQHFSRGKYSRQLGVKMRQLITIENLT